MRPHIRTRRAARVSPRRRAALGLAAVLAVSGAAGMTAAAQAHTADHAGAEPLAASGLNGPYLYLGWGNPPDAAQFMKDTGTKQLTMAFINAKGGCEPGWDGQRPLTGGDDEKTIQAIQSAGGDITPSFGGYSGNKLGEACSDAKDLAGAYQKVVDAYKLKSIDIDIEASEFENADVRQRVVDALKTVKDANDGLKVYVTFPTTAQGPNDNGKDMIKKGADAKLDVDGWTVMPFDFGGGASTDMVDATKSSVDALAKDVAGAYGISDDDAYRKVGFSSMNGKTDNQENVSQDDFKAMVDYAAQHHLARVSFWAVNRDRACAGGGGAGDSCSGIDQKDWEFSKTLAGYQG